MRIGIISKITGIQVVNRDKQKQHTTTPWFTPAVKRIERLAILSKNKVRHNLAYCRHARKYQAHCIHHTRIKLSDIFKMKHIMLRINIAHASPIQHKKHSTPLISSRPFIIILNLLFFRRFQFITKDQIGYIGL